MAEAGPLHPVEVVHEEVSHQQGEVVHAGKRLKTSEEEEEAEEVAVAADNNSRVAVDGGEKRERPQDQQQQRANKRHAADDNQLLDLDEDEHEEDDEGQDEEDAGFDGATQVMGGQEDSSSSEQQGASSGIMRNQPSLNASLVSVGTLFLPTIQLGGSTTIGRAILENQRSFKEMAKQVSREHCVVERHGNVWMVTDKSSNGLFINSIPTPVQQLYRSEGGKVKLEHGDTLIFLSVRNSNGDVDLQQRPIVAYTFQLTRVGDPLPAHAAPYIPTPVPDPSTPVHVPSRVVAGDASPPSTLKRVTFSPQVGSPVNDRPSQQRPVPRKRRLSASSSSSQPGDSVFLAPSPPSRSKASQLGGALVHGAIVTLGVVQFAGPIVFVLYLLYHFLV